MEVWINTAGLMLFAVVSSGCVKPERQVSFQRDVQPILNDKCIECHIPPRGKGYLETGLSMASYQDLMQGTVYGPVIVAGDSRHSILNMVVEGRVDPSLRMPHGRRALGSVEIEILRLWVEHGALNN